MLAEKEGLESGDFVGLEGNPLDCEDEATLETISILESRGVTVRDDCNDE